MPPLTIGHRFCKLFQVKVVLYATVPLANLVRRFRWQWCCGCVALNGDQNLKIEAEVGKSNIPIVNLFRNIPLSTCDYIKMEDKYDRLKLLLSS